MQNKEQFELNVFVKIQGNGNRVREESRVSTWDVNFVKGVIPVSEAPTRTVVLFKDNSQVETLDSKDAVEKKLGWMGKRP